MLPLLRDCQPQMAVNRGHIWGPCESRGWWLVAGRANTSGCWGGFADTGGYTGIGGQVWRCPGRQHEYNYPGYWPDQRELADYSYGWNDGQDYDDYDAGAPKLNKYPSLKLCAFIGGAWQEVKGRRLLAVEAVDPIGMSLSGPWFDVPHLENINVMGVDGSGLTLTRAFSYPTLRAIYPSLLADQTLGTTFLYKWDGCYGNAWWMWAEGQAR